MNHGGEVDTSKLQEILLYIATESSDDPYFGATKLNKILFVADFSAYAYLGESITGATYVHQSYGPVVRELPAAQQALLEGNRAHIVERGHLNYTQKRLTPKSSPNLSLFSRDELDIVNEAIRQVEQMTATQLSDWTHTLQPWLASAVGEVIPYETVFVWKNRTVPLAIKQKAVERLEELRAAGLAV